MNAFRRAVWVATVASVAVGSATVASLSHLEARTTDHARSALKSFAVPNVAVTHMYTNAHRVPARTSRSAPPVAVADPAFVGPIPAIAANAYKGATRAMTSRRPDCHLPWQLLAAIGRVESDNGQTQGNRFTTDGTAVPGIFGPALNGQGGFARIADSAGGFQRAEGPMQFIPSTWAVVGRAASGKGPANPQNINDAALAAGVYLCAPGRDLATPAGRKAAVFSYNHDASYVAIVLGLFGSYEAGEFLVSPSTFTPAVAIPAPSASSANLVHRGVKRPAHGPSSHRPKPTPAPLRPQPTPPPTPLPSPTPKAGTITLLGLTLG